MLKHARKLHDIIDGEIGLADAALPEWTPKGIENPRPDLANAEASVVRGIDRI